MRKRSTPSRPASRSDSASSRRPPPARRPRAGGPPGRGQRREGTQAPRRPEEREAPHLAADLRRELGRRRLRQEGPTAGQPVGRQRRGDLQLEGQGLQPRPGLLLRDLPGLLDRALRLLRAEPGLQRRRRPARAGPVHADREPRRPADDGLGRRSGGLQQPAPVRLPLGGLRPPGRARPVQRLLRQRQARRELDRRCGPGRRGHPGRPGLRGRVGRLAEAALRREALRARQRAGPVERHPPRPAPGPDATTSCGAARATWRTAVKDADPSARTLGFSEWGWPNYFCSARTTRTRGCSGLARPRRARRHGARRAGCSSSSAPQRAAERHPAARLLRPALLPAGRHPATT